MPVDEEEGKQCAYNLTDIYLCMCRMLLALQAVLLVHRVILPVTLMDTHTLAALRTAKKKMMKRNTFMIMMSHTMRLSV